LPGGRLNRHHLVAYGESQKTCQKPANGEKSYNFLLSAKSGIFCGISLQIAHQTPYQRDAVIMTWLASLDVLRPNFCLCCLGGQDYARPISSVGAVGRHLSPIGGKNCRQAFKNAPGGTASRQHGRLWGSRRLRRRWRGPGG
jgi:hypothetical protein